LHLERSRPSAPSSAAPDARRFGALELEPELPDTAAPVPASTAERFREPEGSALALDLTADGEQPFVRCAACGVDHARRSVRCSRCGAALDTAEQRAFNEGLWAARRREAEEERRSAEARRDALEREREEEARARRALAEAMAEEIQRREREREPWFARALRRLGHLLSDR
jgi:hypothetical protein